MSGADPYQPEPYVKIEHPPWSKRATIVLSVVGEGMPLIYNGQEAGSDKRLQFFERDPIQWREHPMGELYSKLFALKHSNSALWNANWGARMIQVPNSAPEYVFSFVRQNEHDKVFAVLNFSAAPHSVAFEQQLYHGSYTQYFSGEAVELDASSRLELEPWSYLVFIRMMNDE